MLIRLFVVILVLMSTVACQHFMPAQQAAPQSDVASWETPDYSAPPKSNAKEIEEIRARNEAMQKQVEDLSKRINVTPSGEEAPAALEEVEPERIEPAPVRGDSTDMARDLARALRRAGVSDLEVATSPAGETYVILPGTISFGAGKADLMKKAQERLHVLSDVIRDLYPDIALRMDGHTDSDPIRKSKWASNVVLSEARSSAVADYFVAALGWPRAKISTQGFGADRPIESNSTRAGKAKNRRVEIVLVP